MIVSEFKELMLSKTISRKTIPVDIQLEHRINTAIKEVATLTTPLRLVVNNPDGYQILRKVDSVTYIRFAEDVESDDSELDIDRFLLDAVALYVLAGIEKEKASIYMGMFYSQIETNDRRLIEANLVEASNENYTEDASMVFA